MSERWIAPERKPRGVAAVEFALVSTVFFMLLLGAMEMGRVLFYWNTATEATRLGARLAVVCDLNAAAVKNQMTALFPVLAAGDIAVAYLPAGCAAGTCQTVSVTVNAGVAIPTYIPFVALGLTLNPFTTTLSRESLASTVGGVANPVCQ
jgi:Flp pilus assembly protein TadG